jgi:hypothetical protein
VRPLIVGIHTGGLEGNPEMARLLIRRELCNARSGVVRLLRSEGPPPDGIEGDPDIVTIKHDPGGTRVSATLVTEDRRSVAGVNGGARYQHIVEKHGLDQSRLADFFEVEGLAAHGADIVITEQPDLLLARDRDLWNDLPIMTPEEAFVIVGVWSRLIQKAWVTGPFPVGVAHFHLWLAHALTPAARRFSVLLNGQAARPYSGDIYELGVSVHEGLARLSRELDQMVVLWQCPAHNDVCDELLAEFDQVIRDVWRVYDNLALMSGYYLDIALDHDPPTLWGLRTEAWKRAMRQSGAPGQAIASLVSSQSPQFDISQQLRHRATHRARFRAVNLQGPRRTSEARIEIEGQELGEIERATKAMGHPTETWGLERTLAGPLLDPMIFAPRLVAHGQVPGRV